MRTPVLLVLALVFVHITSCLKICAFNIQSFGETKANNKKVMGILLKVRGAQPGEQPPPENRQLTFSSSTSPDPLSLRLVPPSGGARL